MSKVYKNFSDDNYIILSKTYPNLTNFKIIFKASSPSYSSHNTLLARYDTNNWIGVRNNSYPSIYVGSWIQGSTAIQENSIYWFCLNYDGTYFNYYTLLDNNYNLNTLPSLENWTYQCRTDYNFFTNYKGLIARNSYGGSEYWKGSIYEGQILVNNSEWFNLQTSPAIGYYNTGCTISKSNTWMNFTDSNYLLTNQLPSSINNAEITFKANFNSDGHNTLFCSTDNSPCSAIENRYGYLPCLYISGWINGSTSLNKETTYWYKVIYDGTNYTLYTIQDYNYTLQNLPNISNWVQQCSTTGNFALQDRQFFIGRGYDSNEYWKGYIEQCQIIIDNQEWFNLSTAVEGTDYTKVGSPIYQNKDNIVSNFSSGNYLRLNPIKYNYNGKNAKGIVRVYFVEATQPQDILTRSSGLDRCWCMFPSNSAYKNKLDFYNGSDHFSTTTFVTENWYYVGYMWDGQTYKFYSLKDEGQYTSYKELPPFNDIAWTLETQYNDTNDLYETGFVLGYNIPVNNGNRYWRGQIDLNNTIIGNNIISWTVGKEGFITQSGMQIITQNTTESATLSSGIKLTINPTPSNAKVTMWADGYKQTPNSNTLVAVEGTVINYKVSLSGYTTVSSTYTLTSSDHTINIVLQESTTQQIIMTYPFNDSSYSTFIDQLTDNGDFIINSELSAITSKDGTSNCQYNSYFAFTTGGDTSTLSVTGYVSSEGGYDFGAVYCGTQIYNMNRDQIDNGTTDGNGQYLFRGSGGMSSDTYTMTLQPDTTYYLNFGYAKDGSASDGYDKLIVTEISFETII